MYRLLIKARAIAMAKEAWEWYEEQQPGLGESFLQDLGASYRKIEKWPASYAKVKSGFRQVILTTFPYVVVFEIIEKDVIVYAVFHTSRSPRKKFKRD
jgi:hypothetical protein